MEGTAVQAGKQLTVDNGTYSCPQIGFNATVRIYNLRPLPGGFTGQYVATSGTSCTETGQFAGVTSVP